MTDGMTRAEYFQKEKELIGTSTVNFDGPLLNSGFDTWLVDCDGKEVLDCTANISLRNTGNSPEEVISAIQQQAEIYPAGVSADWPYWCQIEINGKNIEVSRVVLAERLIEITSKIMPFKKRVYFEVSGATAVNAAMKIAKITFQKKRGIRTEDFIPYLEKKIFIPCRHDLFKASFITCHLAFAGRHGEAQCITNSKAVQLWAASSSSAFGRLSFPVPGVNSEDLFEEVDKRIENLSEYAPVMAFVFEPVQGEGGINVPDGELLKNLVDYLRAKGTYIIADEVQTGFGRTGKMFACEHFGIEPDMIVLSKSLAAGLALGAVVVNDEKLPDLEPGMHSGSHHADPLPVAAAIVNIDLMLKKQLAEKSYNHGVYFLNRLKKIAESCKDIVEVRGLGLMIGAEFKDKGKRDKVVLDCFKNGLLVAPAGAKTIRFTPPLIISIPEIDTTLNIFEKSLN